MIGYGVITCRELIMLEYKYDTQLLINCKDLDEDAINDYSTQNLVGNCLLAVGINHVFYDGGKL